MIELIPAIDIIEGKCVRLSQGDYNSLKTYNDNPCEVARSFEDAGITRLHVVDLDGAKQGQIINYKTLEKIASSTHLTIDFGGGLKTDQDLRIAFESGAQMVTGGSIAVKNRDLFLSWLSQYGSDKIILGADAKDNKIAIGGWLETSEADLLTFVQEYQRQGIQKVICTDISKDGMLAGPSIDLYKEMILSMPDLYLIASGGISCWEDIVALEEAGIPSVIFGKAIYEGKITLNQLSRYLS